MNDAYEPHTFSARSVACGAMAAACLTWLCVGWFGGQGPVTAAAAVVLVELFLACFAMIAVLLTARLSDAYMVREANVQEHTPTPQRLWLWRPLWQPSVREIVSAPAQRVERVPVGHWLQRVYAEMQPLAAPEHHPHTLAFPAGTSGNEDVQRRRAA